MLQRTSDGWRQCPNQADLCFELRELRVLMIPGSAK
jgi:hypothetical protein